MSLKSVSRETFGDESPELRWEILARDKNMYISLYIKKIFKPKIHMRSAGTTV